MKIPLSAIKPFGIVTVPLSLLPNISDVEREIFTWLRACAQNRWVIGDDLLIVTEHLEGSVYKLGAQFCKVYASYRDTDGSFYELLVSYKVDGRQHEFGFYTNENPSYHHCRV